MNSVLKDAIVSEVERLSGHSYKDYDKWRKGKYEADGQTVSKLWDLIESSLRVVIVGDYDVDGTCASYIMATAIKRICPNKKINIRIPRRFSEGYGISEAIVEEIMEKYETGTLVLTVDNGIAAADKLERLEKAGYTVAVTDHHSPAGKRIPQVAFLINPSVDGHDILCGGGYWCGAGVALKMVEQVLDEESRATAEVLAGIATVADCVPLVEGNWQLVRKALSHIRKNKAAPQVSALIGALNQDYRFCNEETIGYYVGPAINAPGRLYDNGGSKILKYLLAPSVTGAIELASINGQRKKLRDEQLGEVLLAVEKDGSADKCPIWVESPGLHEGIIGILAGHLAEQFGVPVIVLTETEDGYLKGSARTAGDINILEYLLNCGANFASMGGHAGAAGMKISKTEFDIAKESQIPKPEKTEASENIIEISTEDIREVYENLAKIAPFGEGNPAPLFCVLMDVDLDPISMMGSKGEHLVAIAPDSSWKVMRFNHNPNDLENPNRFYVGGSISMQSFNRVGIPTLNGTFVFDARSSRERENKYAR